MATVIERLKKRRHYPITVGDEKYWVRSLTIGERKRLRSMSEDGALGLGLGLSMVDEKGNQEFTPAENENDQVFADRVLAELEETPYDTLTEITAAVGRLGQVPSQAELIKN